jgi:hypothetical protein
MLRLSRLLQSSRSIDAPHEASVALNEAGTSWSPIRELKDQPLDPYGKAAENLAHKKRKPLTDETCDNRARIRRNVLACACTHRLH